MSYSIDYKLFLIFQYQTSLFKFAAQTVPVFIQHSQRLTQILIYQIRVEISNKLVGCLKSK